MIELKHLRKEYPNAVPIADVNVTINKGDIIAIIGPSGTGKSTLIRCINQLDKPTSGEVIFEGKNLTDPKEYDKETKMKIGMVFQAYNLFGHMTVLENVMYAPVENKHVSRQEAYEKAIYYLKKVGMGERLFNFPDMLSGGQMQRVAIARALAMEPEIILLDEPTSALDPTMVGEVESVIHDMAKAGKTMMIVTHSMNLAKNVANRVFYMDDGGIYEEGTPEQIFEHPQKERTKAFINQIKTMNIVITSKEHDYIESSNAINNFATLHRISFDETRKIQLIFEEFCMELLLDQIGDSPKILFTLSYSEKNGQTEIEVWHNGPQIDSAKAENQMELRILEKRVDFIDYKEVDEDGYTNYYKMAVK